MNRNDGQPSSRARCILLMLLPSLAMGYRASTTIKRSRLRPQTLSLSAFKASRRLVNSTVSSPPLLNNGDDSWLARETLSGLQSRKAVENRQKKEEVNKQSEVLKAQLLLLGAAALYGTNFSIIKLMGETDMPTGLGSTLRFGLAALATSPWLWMGSSKNEENKKSLASQDDMVEQIGATIAGLEVGLWNSVGYVAQAVGLETTLASKSAFLCSLAVVIVPLLDYLSGKRLEPRQVTGVLLAMLGVGFLEGVNTHELTTCTDVASVIQPFAFGMGFWRMEKAMQKYPNQAQRSTAAQLLAVFLGSAVYTAVMEPSSTDQLSSFLMDPMIWASLFWTGVVSTALSVYMETVALKTLSAAETTLIFSSEPVWGSAFAAAVMGERFGMDAVLGAALILGGCIISNLSSTSPSSKTVS